MNFCIAGKNNIAVNICEEVLHFVQKESVFALINKTDNGCDGFQKSFLKYANTKGIRIVTIEELYDLEDLIFLSLEYDRIICPSKFKSSFLYNIHFSLLPEYKGMYTSALPILHGKRTTGVTLHFIDQGIDTGDIIDQIEFPIEDESTSFQLYNKYIEYGSILVVKYLPKILSCDCLAFQQSHINSSYYSKKEIDYKRININLNSTASQLKNQIRAFNFRPYQMPIVFGHKIRMAEITRDKSKCFAGSILETNNNYIRVSTIDYDVLLFIDRFDYLLECAMNNDLTNFMKVPHHLCYIEEQENIHGWTLLIVASFNGSFKIVKYLLQNGANINSGNYNSTTPFMYAKDYYLKTNNCDVFNYLLLNGADIKAIDSYGKTILDYLKEQSPILYNRLLNHL